MALEPDRHREIIPTSYFATGNGGNGRNEGGNGRNGRNEKMEEIVAETASRILAALMIVNVILHIPIRMGHHELSIAMSYSSKKSLY